MNTTVQRVRALIADGTMTRAGLARAAGLHANTLRDCALESWNPTSDTLRKLDLFLDANDETPVLVGIEEIIDEARNGRMYVLVDDEDRENEGDLIVPAQMATPEAINFMATHGRGLICLSLDRRRVDALGLEVDVEEVADAVDVVVVLLVRVAEAVRGASLDGVLRDAGVHDEEVGALHARLAGESGGHQNKSQSDKHSPTSRLACPPYPRSTL